MLRFQNIFLEFSNHIPSRWISSNRPCTKHFIYFSCCLSNTQFYTIFPNYLSEMAYAILRITWGRIVFALLFHVPSVIVVVFYLVIPEKIENWVDYLTFVCVLIFYPKVKLAYIALKKLPFICYIIKLGVRIWRARKT